MLILGRRQLRVYSIILSAAYAPPPVGNTLLHDFGAAVGDTVEALGYSEHKGPIGSSDIYLNDGYHGLHEYCVGSFADCSIVQLPDSRSPYRPTAVEGANWVVSKAGGGDHYVLSVRGVRSSTIRPTKISTSGRTTEGSRPQRRWTTLPRGTHAQLRTDAWYTGR